MKMSDVEQTLDEPSVESLLKKRKAKKPGIIYLNFIPRYMTVKKVQEYFSEFGEVRRLFLKPERPKKKGKPSKFFSEGWVEFTSKKVAKRVAECLNNTQVGGKRHTPYYDALWSIRYLPKFQWSHLHEREAYQKAEAGQLMRAEIAQAKREMNFYSRGADKHKRRKINKPSNVNTSEADDAIKVPQAKAIDNSCEENKSKDDRGSKITTNFF